MTALGGCDFGAADIRIFHRVSQHYDIVRDNPLFVTLYFTLSCLPLVYSHFNIRLYCRVQTSPKRKGFGMAIIAAIPRWMLNLIDSYPFVLPFNV